MRNVVATVLGIGLGLAAPAAAAPVAAAPAVSVTPAAPAKAASAPPAASAPRTPALSQSVRGDNVLIEGKLYSPQALFIVTRRTEHFGRDAIVPTYLDVRPDAAFLPYRLRADRLATPAAATADSGAAAPGTAR
jgi:hypothetical protein